LITMILNINFEVSMQILKNERNGRLFVATPGLMRNRHMVPASPEEADKFISRMSEDQKEKIEKSDSTKAVSVMMPEGFDPKVDIGNWSKPQLLNLASKIGLTIPTSLKVKDIRGHLQKVLADLASQTEDDGAEEEAEGKPEGDEKPEGDS